MLPPSSSPLESFGSDGLGSALLATVVSSLSKLLLLAAFASFSSNCRAVTNAVAVTVPLLAGA